MKKVLLLFSLSLFIFDLSAQPDNNVCLGAHFIPDVSDFCSVSGEFNNIGADPSGFADPECWSGMNGEADVWYSFIPRNTGVFLQFFGESGITNETIDDSAIAVYSGNCNNLTELFCENVSPNSPDIKERAITDLIPGRLHYIRISSAQATAGSFVFCLTEFTPKDAPEADCGRSVVLCDKSPFFIENLQGVGDQPNEVGNTCIAEEFASVWYTWTAANNGSLTFVITPNNENDPEEDLDFAIFRLPNGLSDCSNKELVRCMASGETQGQSAAANAPCFGATGLSLTDPDFQELPGCNPGDNNFLAALDMVEGESYALIVNNFSRSGFGFNIEFGGTGEFLGPTPQFSIRADEGMECEKAITFTDESLENTDEIISYTWNFGEGAIPSTSEDRGPHNVIYESFGEKRVALTVETLRGCTRTEIIDVMIDPCCADTTNLALNVSRGDLVCFGMDEGFVELMGVAGRPYYFYSIDGGEFRPTSLFSNLAAGEYDVSVQDRHGCIYTETVSILEPSPITVQVSEDDSVRLGFSAQLDSDAGPDDRTFTYEWGPPQGLSCIDCPNPTATPPGTTTYTLTVTDQNGCTATDEVTLFSEINRPIAVPNIISLNPVNSMNRFLWISGNSAILSIRQFRVFDRWGNLVYQVDDLPYQDSPVWGWDGTYQGLDVNPGVYVWSAEITFLDTTLPYHGEVTVVK